MNKFVIILSSILIRSLDILNKEELGFMVWNEEKHPRRNHTTKQK